MVRLPFSWDSELRLDTTILWIYWIMNNGVLRFWSSSFCESSFLVRVVWGYALFCFSLIQQQIKWDLERTVTNLTFSEVYWRVWMLLMNAVELMLTVTEVWSNAFKILKFFSEFWQWLLESNYFQRTINESYDIGYPSSPWL